MLKRFKLVNLVILRIFQHWPRLLVCDEKLRVCDVVDQ